MEREERRWLKLANQFPQHLAEAVRSNNYSFFEYYKSYRLIYDVINADPEHALKDWDKLNFIIREWHWNTDPPDLWRPRSELASLDDNRRASFDVQLAADQSLLRPRRMSRGEAQRVCAADPCIKRLSKWKFHHLLPLDWAFQVKVRDNREIVIHDPLLQGAGDLTYMTTCRNERGHVIHLQPGDNLLCHLDPFRPDELIVLDQGGMIIGMTPRRPDYVPCNSELAHELLGSRARMAADIGAPVRAALQPLANRRADVRESNTALEERMRDVSPPTKDLSPKRPRGGDVDPLASSVQAACTAEPEIDPFD